MTSTRSAHTRRGGRLRIGHALTLLVMMLAIIGAAMTNIGMAAKKAETIISLGESNSDQQRQELLGYFGADKDARVDVITVADTKKAMEDVIPGFNLSSAYSSAALTCLPLGDGLSVQTINITQITPAMYAMALVTAGVGDATLIVAAPVSAPAQGMTALTGIFNAWDNVSCESSQTTPERQALALRELALTVDIASSLGLQLNGAMGYFVIEVQRNMVVNGAKTEADITSVIQQQELTFGITLSAEMRAQLLDLMMDLTKLDIDWSTFSDGWTIERPSNTEIKMTGDGIAIRNAQASATAKAAREQTAEARSQTATAKAEAEMTQTAIAADMTATALAQPTPTATATPLPNAYAGILTGPVKDDQLAIKYADGTEASYQIAAGATITRDGKSAGAEKLKKGDSVDIKVDAMTNEVVEVVAVAPAKSGTPFAKLLFLLPVLLLIPLGMVVKGRSGGDPFVVKRVARD